MKLESVAARLRVPVVSIAEGARVAMPANLPPQYSKAEEELRKAATPADRLEKLRELFRLLPKHKGTEKLQSDLKQKISRAKDDLDGARSSGKKTGVSYRIPGEGAGQVVLLGAPNVGKSSLLAAVTNARPEIAPYPYTTRTPYPGMMPWEDVRVQLIDMPPITADFLEPWVAPLVRSADTALLVADLGDDDVADSVEMVLNRLADVHIELVGDLPFDSEDETIQHVKTVMIASKADADGSQERLEIVREWFGAKFPILSVSSMTGLGLDELRSATYDTLGVIRLYTKVPGKAVDRDHPFTIPLGSTVSDLARAVHRDLEQTLKFARVWGSGTFDGQTVKRDYELRDRDVVELHA